MTATTHITLELKVIAPRLLPHRRSDGGVGGPTLATPNMQLTPNATTIPGSRSSARSASSFELSKTLVTVLRFLVRGLLLSAIYAFVERMPTIRSQGFRDVLRRLGDLATHARGHWGPEDDVNSAWGRQNGNGPFDAPHEIIG